MEKMMLVTVPGMEGCRIKKNDGWGEFRYIARTFAIVTMYPQYNNNNNNERSHMEPPELGKDN
jgi:hypothetical protein